MSPTESKPTKRRKLAARTLSAKQLARAASISVTDIRHAQAAWRADAPRSFRALLDAAPDDRTA